MRQYLTYARIGQLEAYWRISWRVLFTRGARRVLVEECGHNASVYLNLMVCILVMGPCLDNERGDLGFQIVVECQRSTRRTCKPNPSRVVKVYRCVYYGWGIGERLHIDKPWKTYMEYRATSSGSFLSRNSCVLCMMVNIGVASRRTPRAFAYTLELQCPNGWLAVPCNIARST